ARPAGSGPVELVRTESRADWLARVLADILAGIAARRWEYDEFRECLQLHATEAALQVLLREPAEIAGALVCLEERAMLDRLPQRLDELALERLFAAIAYAEGGAVETALDFEELLFVARAAVTNASAAGQHGLASRRFALRLCVHLRREHAALGSILQP